MERDTIGLERGIALLAFVPHRLRAKHMPVRALRDPRHGGTHRAEPPDDLEVVPGVRADQLHQIVGLGEGGDALSSECGLVGVGRQHGGHLVDGGLVAGEQSLGRVLHRRRQAAVEGALKVLVLAQDGAAWSGRAGAGSEDLSSVSDKLLTITVSRQFFSW